MNTQVVPFDNPGLPAHLAALADVSADDLTSGVGGGYPIISIKGKVFHIVRGDDRTLVTKPDAPDEPAASLEVVILKANPALSKTYYATGFVEGSTEKPTCYSNDGVAPAADAQEAQSVKCATCPHNQWGSKISENGSKVKACADVRRVAVAPIGQINDPMLLRIPAASLRPLMEYGDALKKRGVRYPAVSTKIGFDYTVAHPQLTFKPVGFLTEELAVKVVEMIKSDVVAQIVGLAPSASQVQAQATPLPAPAPAAPVPAPQPKAAEPAKPPKAAAPKAAPAKPAPAATPQRSANVEVAGGDNLEAELDAILKKAGFDDAPKQ